MKKIDSFILMLVIGVLLGCYLFSFFGVTVGWFDISFYGFAVDSNDNVYVGLSNGKIVKYKDGFSFETISVMTSRGYEFTILEDDTIYLISSKVYLLDLNGNVLEELKSTGSLYEYRENKAEFVKKDGTVYKQVFNFGRTKIIKETDDGNKVVYLMPLSDYCVKLYITVFSIFIFTAVLFICIRFRKYQSFKPIK